MKIPNYVAAYLLWLVNSLFGLWLAYLARNTWLSAFSRWYTLGSPTREQRAGFYDKILVLIVGFTWLILVIVYESYYRKGVEKKDLFKRFAKTTGPTILVIFAVDAFLAMIQGIAIVGWLRFVILLIELILGILLVRVGWRRAASPETVVTESDSV